MLVLHISLVGDWKLPDFGKHHNLLNKDLSNERNAMEVDVKKQESCDMERLEFSELIRLTALYLGPDICPSTVKASGKLPISEKLLEEIFRVSNQSKHVDKFLQPQCANSERYILSDAAFMTPLKVDDTVTDKNVTSCPSLSPDDLCSWESIVRKLMCILSTQNFLCLAASKALEGLGQSDEIKYVRSILSNLSDCASHATHLQASLLQNVVMARRDVYLSSESSLSALDAKYLRTLPANVRTLFGGCLTSVSVSSKETGGPHEKALQSIATLQKPSHFPKEVHENHQLHTYGYENTVHSVPNANSQKSDCHIRSEKPGKQYYTPSESHILQTNKAWMSSEVENPPLFKTDKTYINNRVGDKNTIAAFYEDDALELQKLKCKETSMQPSNQTRKKKLPPSRCVIADSLNNTILAKIPRHDEQSLFSNLMLQQNELYNSALDRENCNIKDYKVGHISKVTNEWKSGKSCR